MLIPAHVVRPNGHTRIGWRNGVGGGLSRARTPACESGVAAAARLHGNRPGPVLLRLNVGRSERACTCSACSNAAGAAAGSARTHGCEWAVLRVVDCSSEITVQSVIDIAGRIPDEALTPFLEVRPLAPLSDGRARQPIVRGKRGADETIHFRLASAASRSMSAERLRCA